MKENIDKDQVEKIKRFVKKIGGCTKVAKLCGISAAGVSVWRIQGIPLAHRNFLKLKYPVEYQEFFFDSKLENTLFHGGVRFEIPSIAAFKLGFEKAFLVCTLNEILDKKGVYKDGLKWVEMPEKGWLSLMPVFREEEKISSLIEELVVAEILIPDEKQGQPLFRLNLDNQVFDNDVLALMDNGIVCFKAK